LEALEQENFSVLPAPVYARGFLRSYAGYLGLEASDLLPFFPVGHVDDANLEPLPEVRQPRTWSVNGLIAVGVVVALILAVVALYSIGREDSDGSLLGQQTDVAAADQAPDVIVPPADAGPAVELPDLAGQSLQDAITIIEDAGASYIVVSVSEGDIPVGRIVEQSPKAGTTIRSSDLVTLFVSR
jgi:hypothetical protein